MIGDLHAEDLGFAGDILANAPQPQDAELAAADAAGQVHGAVQPLTFAHIAVAEADLARRGEQQGKKKGAAPKSHRACW